MMMLRLSLVLAVTGLLQQAVLSADVVEKFSPESLEFFEKKVRPVLVSRCLECHGDQANPKGGLRLDSREAALDGGETGPAIVPGKPKDSLFISAINYGDVYQMPPKSKMPADEIAVLTKWVEMGAPWPPSGMKKVKTETGIDIAARKAAHWCWQAPKPPSLPTVKNATWAKSEVDRFLLAKLEDKGLTPSPQADKRTLIRRAYFATIGLPPTPEEVSAFVADESPQAFEKVVDRLLGSVHFGERWARHWLDLMRYAETRGHEFEPIIPNAWQYRDYVIRALNADTPYDQFVTEHLAGDLMEKPRLSSTGSNESLLGTGFWFLGEEVHSPVDIRQDETDRIDNRLDVLSKSFLALTLSCARCHDHKFDAMTQRDYYGLAGFALGGSYRQAAFELDQHNRRIAEQLDVLRRDSRDALVKSVVAERLPVVEKLADYLNAANEAVRVGVSFEGRIADVVFADFEGDSYGGWKTEGEAFGDRPPRKQDNRYEAPLEGFQGQRLANSHRNGPDGKNNAGVRDAFTGKLTSPKFRIGHNHIAFLIAGGNHEGQTCINLIVNGKVVRTATGHDSGHLRPVDRDVTDVIGQEANIEIVDAHAGGWGHVIVDHIEFKNGGSQAPKVAQLTAASREAVTKLAQSKNLDAELLLRWVLEVKSGEISKLLGLVQSGAAEKAEASDVPAAGVVVDYTRVDVPFYQDGISFGLRPTHAGDLRFGTRPEQPLVGLHEYSAATRDMLAPDLRLIGDRDHGGLGGWERSGRTIRTPETTLTEPKLWYLVRGSGRAYATVNSHLIIAGPLHGHVLMQWDGKPDEWKWVAHNLQTYKGNRLHVEFTPKDAGEFAVAMVVQSDAQPAFGIEKTQRTRRSEPIQRTGAAIDTQHLQAMSIKAMKEFASGSLHDVAEIRLLNWMLQHDELLVAKHQPNAVIEKFVTAQAELLKQFKTQSQLAPSMLDGNGVDEVVLIRGNSKTPSKVAPRRFLEAVTGTLSNYGAGSGRLKLAQQIVDPTNPLTARVAVNRIWHHLFGRGIVPTVDNFGVLGELPSHPELLDHLALQFMRDGWSQKKLIKALMMSNAYQMASTVGGPAEQVDPDNRLLHRMPIRRLEGEVIRDSILAVSGRLDRTAFGQSVPIHLTAFMDGRGRPGVNGPLDGSGRRSIYIAVRRNFLSPWMLAFDTPNPFSTVGRRTNSNVPAQALILMNDPLVLEQSRLWAQRIIAEPAASDEERIRRIYETALSRQPRNEELVAAVAFLASQSERLGLTPQSKGTPFESWTDLCHVIFNVKEFIFVN